MESKIIDLITTRIGELNKEIAADPLLGDNYRVGHSFFCPKGSDFSDLDRNWYDGIIETEIVPLIQEYWFDNAERVKDLQGKLTDK